MTLMLLQIMLSRMSSPILSHIPVIQTQMKIYISVDFSRYWVTQALT
uniref:Uncharacterized protein n=1 Tax=Arundo donax TaxID=35708 RepID=A0A0A9D7M7_ARUDO